MKSWAHPHVAYAADPKQLTSLDFELKNGLTTTQIPEWPVGGAQAEQIWIALQSLWKLNRHWNHNLKKAGQN